MDNTFQSEFRRLAGFIKEWRAPCAVVGGAAIIARVQPRFTDDLDLAITVSPTDHQRLLTLARAHGYDFDPKETRDFIEGGLVRLWGPPSKEAGIGLDLLFTVDPLTRSVVQRATPMQIFDVWLPVASPEDLLLMKLEANRGVDVDDAIGIKTVFASSLDREYLNDWADKLGIRARLDALLGA